MQSRNVDPQKPIQQFPAALQPVVERLQHLQDMPQVNHEEMSAGCAPNVVAIERNFMRLCMGQLPSQQQTSQLLLAAMPPMVHIKALHWLLILSAGFGCRWINAL